MDPKNNLDARLAAELARPFVPSGKPLSFRSLPDGGMVVIAADGRKLWFTCREVNEVRRKFRAAAVKPSTRNDGLTELDQVNPPPFSGNLRTRDGVSQSITLPPDLKYLERIDNDHADFPGRPSTPRPE
jgi:hypothetical protein